MCPESSMTWKLLAAAAIDNRLYLSPSASITESFHFIRSPCAAPLRPSSLYYSICCSSFQTRVSCHPSYTALWTVTVSYTTRRRIALHYPVKTHWERKKGLGLDDTDDVRAIRLINRQNFISLGPLKKSFLDLPVRKRGSLYKKKQPANKETRDKSLCDVLSLLDAPEGGTHSNKTHTNNRDRTSAEVANPSISLSLHPAWKPFTRRETKEKEFTAAQRLKVKRGPTATEKWHQGETRIFFFFEFKCLISNDF